MRVTATFTSKRFPESKSVVLICRETGTRYSYSEAHPFDSTPIFREGEVMAYRRGTAPILHCIESDARWQIRQDLANQRAEVTGHRVALWQ